MLSWDTQGQGSALPLRWLHLPIIGSVATKAELVMPAGSVTSHDRPFRWSARFPFAESSGPREAGAALSPARRPQ